MATKFRSFTSKMFFTIGWSTFTLRTFFWRTFITFLFTQFFLTISIAYTTSTTSLTIIIFFTIFERSYRITFSIITTRVIFLSTLIIAKLLSRIKNIMAGSVTTLRLSLTTLTESLSTTLSLNRYATPLFFSTFSTTI